LGCSGSPCTPTIEARWSPANNVTATNCPSSWLVINSEHETTPLTQANTMVETLRAHGCNATEVVRKSGHAFAYWNSELATILSFVRGSLAPQGSTSPR
jgi:S-formylglutathione hydrolase FrmB